MTIDSNLLEKARTAGAQLADAERQVLVSRADYHTAIRRLHLAGAPLREIAERLSLSHQRVQQIVNAAGGSWWQVWRGRRSTPDAVCTWCDRPPSEVTKLIAGPKVFICDECVAAAERRMSPSARERRTGEADHVRASRRCAFCSKRAGKDRQLAPGAHSICSDCLRACRGILDAAI